MNKHRQSAAAAMEWVRSAATYLARDKIAVGGTLAALALIALLGWAFYPPPPDTSGKKKYVYMHCTECMEEFPYNERMLARGCPSCGPGSKLFPTINSVFEGGDDTELTWARVLAWVVLMAIVLMTLPFLWRWRLKVLHEEEDAVLKRPLRCRCPFCKRKMGYPANRVGAIAACPRCKTSFQLPAGELEEAS